jgi:hypothetical protein
LFVGLVRAARERRVTPESRPALSTS